MIITRAISVTNFVVASSALGFQVGVLYPWHKQLDDDFEALKKEHIRVLNAIESKPSHSQALELVDESRSRFWAKFGNLATWRAA